MMMMKITSLWPTLHFLSSAVDGSKPNLLEQLLCKQHPHLLKYYERSFLRQLLVEGSDFYDLLILHIHGSKYFKALLSSSANSTRTF